MSEKLLFLTGRLAEPRLQTTVAQLGLPEGSWRIANIGIKVAALMTEAIVRNRLKPPLEADRVILPGRCRMDLKSLEGHFGVPFERGPDELADLPQFFGKDGRPVDLTQNDLRIFGEIIEAPHIPMDEFVARARADREKGADVVDIGCQPDVPFPHLEDLVKRLKAEGFKVSIDSGNIDELARGARAGADYVLSLDETSLDAIAGTACVPILVPKPHGDLDSLLRAIDKANSLNIPHIADPILDPIHFGFAASVERYIALRRARPDVEILMGTGNLTELTDADSQGLTACLLGLCSELHIQNVLVVQVSPHTRRTIQEHDAARRLMFRAREDESLPKGYGGGLISLHDLNPVLQSPGEIGKSAQSVKDDNFRIEVSDDGVHIYNRQGHHISTDPFELYPKLGVDADGAHAFYLGYELARAEIAMQLGKRFVQDNPLDWGVAADRKKEDLTKQAAEGATLKAKEQRNAEDRRDDRDDRK
jgi:dihydropteroate synthase-like protein